MLKVMLTKEAIIVLPQNLCEILGIYEKEEVDVEVKNEMLWIHKVNRNMKRARESERFKMAKGSWKGININFIYKELDESWKKWKPKEFV
ncbi:MAG: hypothetical protein QME42_10010 [bacterium]|nr:hypothetical protein [bacterium]